MISHVHSGGAGFRDFEYYQVSVCHLRLLNRYGFLQSIKQRMAYDTG